MNRGNVSETKMELIHLLQSEETTVNAKIKKMIEEMEDIDESITYIDAKNDFNVSGTLLTLACQEGKREVVSFLVEAGCDVNLTDGETNSALMIVVSSGHTEILEILLNAGANFNYSNPYGDSAFSESIANDKIDIFYTLMRCGMDFETCGGMALITASIKGHTEIINALVDSGVDINKKSSIGWTSLHYACANNNLKIIELLLNRGADENIKDNTTIGRKPIELTRNEEVKKFIEDYSPSQFVLK